jgi:hypothetical protein
MTTRSKVTVLFTQPETVLQRYDVYVFHGTWQAENANPVR